MHKFCFFFFEELFNRDACLVAVCPIKTVLFGNDEGCNDGENVTGRAVPHFIPLDETGSQGGGTFRIFSR